MTQSSRPSVFRISMIPGLKPNHRAWVRSLAPSLERIFVDATFDRVEEAQCSCLSHLGHKSCTYTFDRFINTSFAKDR
jgi:hypothetical protein